MKILVTGGRNFDDYALLERTLDQFFCLTDIVQGGARGADTLAAKYAESKGLTCHTFPVNWDLHGKGAGPIRNQIMLRESRPDLVLAFPGGRGTADMVARARKAGTKVILVEKEPS